jgi:hypothetical protein
MSSFPAACVDLLSQLTSELGLEPTTDWIAALREIGAAIVGALPDLKKRNPAPRIGIGGALKRPSLCTALRSWISWKPLQR